MALKILADRNIPFVADAFRHVGSVRVMAGNNITPADIKETDILLVRSVTQVSEHLVAGSSIQFVGSATIGTDHIDTSGLMARGIAFAHARGAGAESVAEYVIAALMVVANRENWRLNMKTLGIVGCGDIGVRVGHRAEALGMRVLRNDPPRADASKGRHAFVPLGPLLRESDIVTLHVPLTHTGQNATRHLIGEPALRRMKPGAWLINTARGPVVDGAALEAALRQGVLRGAVIDVWEDEPTPDLRLLRSTSIATPHIAGHSFDGKLQGTVLLYHAVTNHFGLEPAWDYSAIARPPAPISLTPPCTARHEAAWLDGLVRKMYDIRADDARMRTLLQASPRKLGTGFRALRINYPRRRAFRWHRVAARAVPASLRKAVCSALRVQLFDIPEHGHAARMANHE